MGFYGQGVIAVRASNILLVAVVAVLLAACGSAPTPVAVMVPPSPPPRVMVDPDTACRAELTAEHASFMALDNYGEGQCRIANPVKISSVTVPLNRPGVVSCDMARDLTQFVTTVVQPLAQKYFGQGVIRIDHMGTYDCRAKRTVASTSKSGSSKGGSLSEHSKGQAIDFAGVELADGRLIYVRENWRTAGAPGMFLHELARSACNSFNVVLTPNHDKLHWDHIHMDIGPYSLCGI